jgi:hypothetical protein
MSTVHQQHVQWHQAAFRRARKILHAFLIGRAKLPSTIYNSQCVLGYAQARYSVIASDEKKDFEVWLSDSQHNIIDA